METYLQKRLPNIQKETPDPFFMPMFVQQDHLCSPSRNNEAARCIFLNSINAFQVKMRGGDEGVFDSVKGGMGYELKFVSLSIAFRRMCWI